MEIILGKSYHETGISWFLNFHFILNKFSRDIFIYSIFCNIIIDMSLKAGKITPEILKEMLKKIECSSQDLVIGPSYGIDGAVLKIGEELVAVASDPITFTSKDNVYYLFACNINDLICMGAKPEFLGMNVLFGEGITKAEVAMTFNEIARFSKEFNICVVTGHTEVTPYVKETILSGFIFGRVIKEVSPHKILPGDLIVQLRGVAIEGTCIIAREKAGDLIRNFSPEFVERCKDFLFEPGISLYSIGIKLLENYEIHNLHDPTEGGIITALYEALSASGCGGVVYVDRIHIYEETAKICNYYGINPLGVISSGSLVVFASPAESERMCSDFEREGIPAEVIGEVTAPGTGVWLQKDGSREELKPFLRDEILEIL